MRPAHQGGILLEVVVSITLVALALTGVSQLLLVAGQQQRAIDRRQLASREAGNTMERIMLREFEEITSDQLAGWSLPSEVQQQLPAAQLAIVVRDETDPAPARRVQVEVRWHRRGGLQEQVQLVAWKYAGVP